MAQGLSASLQIINAQNKNYSFLVDLDVCKSLLILSVDNLK